MVWNKLCWDGNNAVGLKTKELLPVQPNFPLFWKSHCVICIPALFILYHVTRFSKGTIADLTKLTNWPSARLILHACSEHLDRSFSNNTDQNLVDCWPRCWLKLCVYHGVNWVLIKCLWRVDWRILIKGVDRHLTPDAFSTHDPAMLWIVLMQVTEANLKLMKQLILNGADKHPGANFIQQRQTNIRK